MPTMPVLCLLWLYYAYYACTITTMPTIPVLCLYYAYHACTMSTMLVLCLLCMHYACTMPTVVFSVAPTLIRSYHGALYIVDTIYNFIYRLFIPLTNILLSNNFHTRENLFITTITHHYSVPGDVTQVTKQIFCF